MTWYIINTAEESQSISSGTASILVLIDSISFSSDVQLLLVPWLLLPPVHVKKLEDYFGQVLHQFRPSQPVVCFKYFYCCWKNVWLRYICIIIYNDGKIWVLVGLQDSFVASTNQQIWGGLTAEKRFMVCFATIWLPVKGGGESHHIRLSF